MDLINFSTNSPLVPLSWMSSTTYFQIWKRFRALWSYYHLARWVYGLMWAREEDSVEPSGNVSSYCLDKKFVKSLQYPIHFTFEFPKIVLDPRIFVPTHLWYILFFFLLSSIVLFPCFGANSSLSSTYLLLGQLSLLVLHVTDAVFSCFFHLIFILLLWAVRTH